MPKPNVTRVQSATEWTASVHTLHRPKPNVTRVQSAAEWTASVHTLHMPKPMVTRVQSPTEWTASVHTLHMPKPNVTRVQSGSQWCASVIHMPKCMVTIVFKRLRHGVVRSYFTYVQTMLRHVVISLSFVPSFFVIHDSCLTLINLNEKFQTEKIRCKNF